MLTVIVGQQSNLTDHLRARLAQCVVVSARALLTDLRWRLPEAPHRLIINSFQPATKLRDTSDLGSYLDLAVGVTSRVLGSLATSGCQRVIYTSSASVYGDAPSAVEEQDPRPGSLAATLKLANEQMVSERCESLDVEYTVMRMFNLYGGADRFSIVSHLLTAAENGSVFTLYNGGGALRDYIHVADVVRVYQAVLAHGGPRVLNIGTGRGTSVGDLVAHVQKMAISLATTQAHRSEISASVASTTRLGELLDVDEFLDVRSYLTRRLSRRTHNATQLTS